MQLREEEDASMIEFHKTVVELLEFFNKSAYKTVMTVKLQEFDATLFELVSPWLFGEDLEEFGYNESLMVADDLQNHTKREREELYRKIKDAEWYASFLVDTGVNQALLSNWFNGIEQFLSENEVVVEMEDDEEEEID